MGRVADANVGAGASQYYTSHRRRPRGGRVEFALGEQRTERRGRVDSRQPCLGFAYNAMRVDVVVDVVRQASELPLLWLGLAHFVHEGVTPQRNGDHAALVCRTHGDQTDAFHGCHASGSFAIFEGPALELP